MNFACFAQLSRHLAIAGINLFRMGKNDPSPSLLVWEALNNRCSIA